MRFVDGAWKVSKEPTCTEAGREERTCFTCGEKESREIPALGHELEAVTEVAATIDAVGTKAHYRCSAYGELFLDAEGKQGVDAADLVIEKLEAVTTTLDDCIEPKDGRVVVASPGAASSSLRICWKTRTLRATSSPVGSFTMRRLAPGATHSIRRSP